MLIENILQAAKSIWRLTLEHKAERKSIFDYKMYISYLRCYYHSRILLSSKAWPLRGHVGFTGDFVHLAVFKRHQIRDQACSGAIREVERGKTCLKSPMTKFRRILKQVFWRDEVLHPRPLRCKRDNPEWRKFRRNNLFWHTGFYLFILY